MLTLHEQHSYRGESVSVVNGEPGHCGSRAGHGSHTGSGSFVSEEPGLVVLYCHHFGKLRQKNPKSNSSRGNLSDLVRIYLKLKK